MTAIEVVCAVVLAALLLAAYVVLWWSKTYGRDMRLFLEASARTHRIDPTGLPNSAVVMMIHDAINGGIPPTSERVAGRIALALNLPPAAITVADTLRRGEVLVTVRFPWWRLRRAKWLEVARGVAERYSPAWTVVLVEAAK